MAQKGIVFNIQRFTIHDGPGIRTELFLKGCPMRCHWCSNPESQVVHIQPGVYSKKCISYKKCAMCESVCLEEGALQFDSGKLKAIDYGKCTNCMECEGACPSEAIKQWGEAMTVEDSMTEIRKDIGFYQRSGGGITVSGGEPLLQSDFVAELFKACHEEGIQTCCESTFCVDWSEIQKILPYTDIFISDIKHMDSEEHKKYTGLSNKQILENLKKLAETGRELILRIPVIPNVNDSMENIDETAKFIKKQLKGHVSQLQLLSFMRLGVEKYESLGMPYKMDGVKVNRNSFQKQIKKIAEYFNEQGINCIVGTKEEKEKNEC